MPGLIKIGKTTTTPNQRMSELHTTGVPTPFILEFSVEVDDCHSSEKAAHSALAKHRVSDTREFFRISVVKALEKILPVIGCYKIHEVQSSHGIKSIEQELNYRRLEAQRREESRREEIRQYEIEQQRIKERRRKELEAAITTENRKLQQLGLRPVRKELLSIGSVLAFAYLPIPVGWMVWAGAFRMFFDSKGETTGLVCILLLIVGYFANKIENEYGNEYENLNKPFATIDNRIAELKNELDKFS